MKQCRQVGGWRYGLRCLMAGAVLSLLSAPAHASTDPMIEGGRLCTQQFPLQEQHYHIPTHLLAAISTTESGRYHKGLGMSVPWPWTINVNGKGYWFNTKAEAIAQTQRLMEQGNRSIDVGCMQVNLKHHAKAFGSLEQAFDPEANVAYAAKFLRDNYADLGDWIKATAAYHSRTQVHGQRYLTQIEKSWNSIVSKVAAARVDQGKQVRMAQAGQAPAEVSAAMASAPRASTNATVRPVSVSRRERVIKVGNAPRISDSEILVIRGATTRVESAVKESSPSVKTVAIQGTTESMSEQPGAIASDISGDSVRRVTLDNPGRNAQPEPNTFVFVD